VVFIDSTLYEAAGNMRAETEFALLAGFQHSMAILQQMSCLNYDFSRFELAEEV
jgi:choline dehydrogenase-like flavoprotein|tara:strand:+ start:288 stop:449 length:162 start_codon:yes stop_codon:yes gene_type:complete